MTWEQFKESVENQGVKDVDNIAYIDISGLEEVTAKQDVDGSWLISSEP